MFQYQFFENDCLLACNYFLIKQLNTKFMTYSQYLKQYYKNKSWNLNELEASNNLLNIKTFIQTLDKNTAQSLLLTKPIILIKKINNNFHSVVCYKIIKNKFYCFCPTIGKFSINYLDFCNNFINVIIYIKLKNNYLIGYNGINKKEKLKIPRWFFLKTFLNLIFNFLLVVIIFLTRDLIINTNLIIDKEFFVLYTTTMLFLILSLYLSKKINIKYYINKTVSFVVKSVILLILIVFLKDINYFYLVFTIFFCSFLKLINIEFIFFVYSIFSIVMLKFVFGANLEEIIINSIIISLTCNFINNWNHLIIIKEVQIFYYFYSNKVEMFK